MCLSPYTLHSKEISMLDTIWAIDKNSKTQSPIFLSSPFYPDFAYVRIHTHFILYIDKLIYNFHWPQNNGEAQTGSIKYNLKLQEFIRISRLFCDDGAQAIRIDYPLSKSLPIIKTE